MHITEVFLFTLPFQQGATLETPTAFMGVAASDSGTKSAKHFFEHTLLFRFTKSGGVSTLFDARAYEKPLMHNEN